MSLTAVYVRVSSEDQADRGTIQNQVEFATKYCDLHQLLIGEWYRDDGISGTIPLEKRPDGSRLVQDARDKRIDTLLVYMPDRLGRTARVILNAVYELEQYDVKVKSMTEPFDTGDPVAASYSQSSPASLTGTGPTSWIAYGTKRTGRHERMAVG